MDPRPSSFCLLPAQIWYRAVAATEPKPAARPARLEEIWGSVTVASPTPRHTTNTDAVTRGLALRP